MAKYLIGLPQADISIRTPFGFNLMHLACQKSNFELYKQLNELGFSGWNEQNEYLDTPFHLVFFLFFFFYYK